MEVSYKLYFSKILELVKDPKNNYYNLGKLIVKNVDLMGLVIEKKELKNNILVLKVDDGTGVLECVYYLPVSGTAAMDDLQTEEGSKDLLKHLKLIRSSVQEVNVGDTIHIKGYISEFNGKREVKAQTFRHVTNINEEIHRVFEMEMLNRNVYEVDHIT